MNDELFSQRAMSTERLAMFCRFAAAGSIAGAMGPDVNQQSIGSRWISELEQAIGFRLTEKRGRKLAVNAAGARFARLLREHFEEMLDFVRSGRGEQLTLRIGAGNSTIEWLLASRLGALQAEFPAYRFDVENLRTDAVLAGLADLTLDLGIVRADALPRTTNSSRARGTVFDAIPFGEIRYRLFVPVPLLPRRSAPDVASLLSLLPLATSKGGAFNTLLETAAAKAGLPLRVRLGCASFTQAARAVRGGKFAGILPEAAASDLPAEDFRSFALDPLVLASRRLVLAWNRRIAAIRPSTRRIAERLRIAR